MKKTIAAVTVLLILLSGCSTINNLHEYNIYEKRIAMDMMIPPEPSVYIDYTPVNFGEDKLLAAVQLGSNLLKAGEAAEAEEKMLRALDGLYIPEYAAELTFDRIVKYLDGTMTEDLYDADIILEIDVKEYGIEAYSYGGEVAMTFAMTARFYHPEDNKIIWQRHVSVDRQITPGFFGVDNIIGNAITIASLNNLDEEQLSEGFKAMTSEIMKETINLLKKDLRKARDK